MKREQPKRVDDRDRQLLKEAEKQTEKSRELRKRLQEKYGDKK